MAKRGKKYKEVHKKKITDTVSLEEGVKKVKELSYSSFTGAVDLHVALKLDKDTDPKSLKGTLTLPHSAGEVNTRIAVFTSKDNEKAAVAAGADIADMETLMKDVQAGKVDFDVAIATPDVMPQIARLGKELGPRGLMPNPKTGTVTPDFAKAIKEYKSGKMTIKADSTGAMHMKVGTVDMSAEDLLENIDAALLAITDTVGKRVESIVKVAHLAPTMGPSVKVDIKKSEE